MRAPDDTVERAHLLAELLGGESGDGQGDGASVVYVTLQKTAVEVSQMLIAAGFDARPYHAGLPLAQREVRSWWLVCTIRRLCSSLSRTNDGCGFTLIVRVFL